MRETSYEATHCSNVFWENVWPERHPLPCYKALQLDPMEISWHSPEAMKCRCSRLHWADDLEICHNTSSTHYESGHSFHLNSMRHLKWCFYIYIIDRLGNTLISNQFLTPPKCRWWNISINSSNVRRKKGSDNKAVQHKECFNKRAKLWVRQSQEKYPTDFSRHGL